MDALTKKSFSGAKLRDPRRDQKAFNEMDQLKEQTNDEMMEEEGELQEKLSPLPAEEERPRSTSASPLNPQEIARRVHGLYSEILEGRDLSAQEISHFLMEAINFENQLEKIKEKRSDLMSEMEKMAEEEEKKIRELQGTEMDTSQNVVSDDFVPQLASNFFSKSTSMLGDGDTVSPYSNVTAATLPDFYLAETVEWTKVGLGSGTTVSEAFPAAGNLSFGNNNSNFVSGESSSKQDEIPSFPELSGRITSMCCRIVEEYPIIKPKNEQINQEESLEGDQGEEATVTTPQALLTMLIPKPSSY